MDAELLEELYRKYHRSALLYCTALCGDLYLAQDIAAEAFIKAYLSLPDGIPSSGIGCCVCAKTSGTTICAKKNR